MDVRKKILISSACLILIAVAIVIAAPSGLMSGQILGSSSGLAKIDSSLNSRMDSGGDDIPIIVILNGKDSPELSGIDVKYRYHLINGVAGSAKPEAIKKIAQSDSVKMIYLDDTAKLAQPIGARLGNGTIVPAKNVNADALWSRGIDGRGVIVAVVDSGIDKNHPDLAGKVIGEKNFVKSESTTNDLLGHGTSVAGIIAGSGAASGGKYRGIAPGASLLNVKVIDKSGNGQVSDIIAGIEWALDNNAKVISLSLAGLNLGETNPPVTMAADNAMDAGAVICVAAGNSG